jgi:hypothetical protein
MLLFVMEENWKEPVNGLINYGTVHSGILCNKGDEEDSHGRYEKIWITLCMRKQLKG